MNDSRDFEACSLKPHELAIGDRQQLIKSIFIKHDKFNEVYGAISRAHHPVVGGIADYGSIFVVVGESRVGKTFAARRYMKDHQPSVAEDGMIYPVLYVDIPIDGQRALLEALADGLGLKYSLRLNTSGLVSIIIKGLKQQRVEVLILDELNTIVHGANKRGVGYVLNFLRKILNECRLNIICIGLTETYDLLAADPQLTGRGGLPCHVVKSYSWESEVEQKLFRLLCGEFDKRLPFEERSKFESSWFAQRLFLSSKSGNIGRLSDFIYAAGCAALNESATRIDVEHLATAYERTKAPGVQFNPWLHNPDLAPKDKNPSQTTRSPNDIFAKSHHSVLIKVPS